MEIALFSGAGNTFCIADNRKGGFCKKLIQPLCERHHVDGVLLVESSSRADAFMRIFNRDGSEAEMCGNGLRCFVYFLKELGIERTIYQIDTLAGEHQGWCVEEVPYSSQKGEVCIRLPPPTQLRLNIRPLSKCALFDKMSTFCADLCQNFESMCKHMVEKFWHKGAKKDNFSKQMEFRKRSIRPPTMHFLNTGVPHTVVSLSSIADIDVCKEGSLLRHDPLFAPAGTNVDFMELLKDGTLNIRTYERGVEGETPACGTGVVAAACIAHKIYQLPSPVTVRVRSGDSLKVFFNSDWSEVILQGPVQRERSFEIKD